MPGTGGTNQEEFRFNALTHSGERADNVVSPGLFGAGLRHIAGANWQYHALWAWFFMVQKLFHQSMLTGHLKLNGILNVIIVKDVK
jgi:hypothetical protein